MLGLVSTQAENQSMVFAMPALTFFLLVYGWEMCSSFCRTDKEFNYDSLNLRRLDNGKIVANCSNIGGLVLHSMLIILLLAVLGLAFDNAEAGKIGHEKVTGFMSISAFTTAMIFYF